MLMMTAHALTSAITTQFTCQTVKTALCVRTAVTPKRVTYGSNQWRDSNMRSHEFQGEAGKVEWL